MHSFIPIITLSTILSLVSAQNCNCPVDFSVLPSDDDCLCCPGQFIFPDGDGYLEQNYTGIYCCVQPYTDPGTPFNSTGSDDTTSTAGTNSSDVPFSFGGDGATSTSTTPDPFCFDCPYTADGTASTSSADPFSFGGGGVSTTTASPSTNIGGTGSTTITSTLSLISVTSTNLKARNIHAVQSEAPLVTSLPHLRRDATTEGTCITTIPLTASDYSSLALAASSLTSSSTTASRTTSSSGSVATVSGNAGVEAGHAAFGIGGVVAGVVVAAAALL